MSGELLRPGDEVKTWLTKQSCRIIDFLGGGGQGEVYRAELAGDPIAVKWYFPSSLSDWQRQSLEKLCHRPAPSPAAGRRTPWATLRACSSVRSSRGNAAAAASASGVTVK